MRLYDLIHSMRGTQVNWEFWSNSNDMCGPVCDVQKEFIKASPLSLMETHHAAHCISAFAMFQSTCMMCDRSHRGSSGLCLGSSLMYS